MTDKFVAMRHRGAEPGMLGNIEAMLASYTDVINLSVGDPDLITPEPIIEASYRDSLAGHTHYTAFRGDPELRAEIVKFYAEDYGVSLSDENIYVTPSANMGMFIALFTCIDPGDEVLIPDPCFPVYQDQIRYCGAKAVTVPTYEEEHFRFNPDRAKALVTPKTKALIINTPNNPTGACMGLEDMKAIADFAQTYDLLVLSDDIYTAMSFQECFVPIISLPGMAQRTITLNSTSKNFAMTGYRLGWNIAPPHLAEAMRKTNDNMVFTAPAPSQRAAIHALRHRKELVPPLVEEFSKRVFLAADRINAMDKLSVLPPMGTFYLFANIKRTGLSSVDFVYKVLEEAQVLVLAGTAFGAMGEGYVRIACTVGVDKLAQAMDRIAAIDF